MTDPRPFPSPPPELSAEETIRRAARLAEFLKDPIIVNALGNLKLRNYEAFENATSSEDRVRAWAKANALKDFADELTVVIHAGERIVLQMAKDAQKAPGPERKS